MKAPRVTKRGWLAVLAAGVLVTAAGILLLLGRAMPMRSDPQAVAASRSVHLPGGPVRYVDGGDASGAPLLLLHGNGASLSQWDEVRSHLQSCPVRVIAIDVPGFGGSTWKSRDFSPETQADRIVAFLDELDVAAVAVAGTSMGASLAATIAVRHPGRVRRLGLFAPSGYPGSLVHRGLYGKLVRPGVLNTAATWIAGTPLFTWMFPRSMATEILTMTAGYGERWAQSLRDIRVATLIAWSAGDRTADAAAAPEVQKLIAGSALLLLDEETGHSIPTSRPALSAALLCELAGAEHPPTQPGESVLLHLRPGEYLGSAPARQTRNRDQ